jgi:hypothetical protein
MREPTRAQGNTKSMRIDYHAPSFRYRYGYSYGFATVL